MIGDPWPEEPDEPLVEKYRDGNPEEDLAPDVDAGEVPEELRRTFWTLVGIINAGLLATSLGAMLVGFRGEWQRGGAMFLVGVAALVWAGYKYRSYARTLGDDADDAGRTDAGHTDDGSVATGADGGRRGATDADGSGAPATGSDDGGTGPRTGPADDRKG